MVCFSCFNTHVQSNKPKSTLKPSADAIVKKASQDGAQKQVYKDSSILSSSEFQICSGPANDGSAFLVGEPMPLDEDAREIFDTRLSAELACNSHDHAAGHGAPSLMHEMKQKEVVINESDDQIRGDKRVANMGKIEFPESYANTIDGVTPAREDHRVTTGMEAAKRYILALSASATEAQLPNHGLLVVPLFSRFENLEVLNLSGNSIVRISRDAFPPRLHSLNLSKNNISIIEGMRKLTRLRVLDLSCNHIRKIGHGLASCSSLKELYLAGNNITEVEGLHRLLKLSILDIRFNEISSAKCLGQLATNYYSLQAISLDGNPTQKSVGDEELKKYLQAILSRLVYYNGEPIKVSTLKYAADESIELGMNSHQFDLILRLDHKAKSKGSHDVVAAQRVSNTSTHARRSKTSSNSSKLSKGKYNNTVLLPPAEAVVSTRNRYSRKFLWLPILI